MTSASCLDPSVSIQVAFNPALDEYNLRLVYDKDDAFFVPLAGFEAVTRPGPTLLVYGRSPIAADPPASRR